LFITALARLNHVSLHEEALLCKATFGPIWQLACIGCESCINNSWTQKGAKQSVDFAYTSPPNHAQAALQMRTQLSVCHSAPRGDPAAEAA
jgi:hypothetical protein